MNNTRATAELDCYSGNFGFLKTFLGTLGFFDTTARNYDKLNN